MAWFQKNITIEKKNRGFHLITDELLNKVPDIETFKIGILHIFIMHTSASITINENADSTVRDDMESHFNKFVPENQNYYRHTFEGSDDMPAHIKAITIGNNVAIHISDGHLCLGTWQGIYLCEHRNHANGRKLMVTINGEKF
tara:strand:- start:120 stop:548 length:429 start_codon:yes stop_codon:yes gene_type:complete